MRDDIPEAIRQSVNKPAKASLPIVGIVLGGTVVAAIVLATAAWLRPSAPPEAIDPPAAPSSSSPATQPAATVAVTSAPSSQPDQLLGHLAYSEAPLDELQPISPDGRIQLRRAAAEAYLKMVAAAAAAGVHLVPISGFRSKAEQNDLFFRVKEERNQDVSKRAEVSAPPGHSEHHTGYAIDIGDLDQPNTNLSQSFEDTQAFQWLSEHAAQYSFELSFKHNNPQGVSYEPWHWRFVGDQNSLETFYRAQNLKGGSP
jgi:D-alanyl-D-alanine carboxypeptidase